MKKKYLKPTSEILNIESESILAGSELENNNKKPSNEEGYEDANQFSKHFNVWDTDE